MVQEGIPLLIKLSIAFGVFAMIFIWISENLAVFNGIPENKSPKFIHNFSIWGSIISIFISGVSVLVYFHLIKFFLLLSVGCTAMMVIYILLRAVNSN